jgi:pantoate--beta-alanine ligase
VSTQLVQTIAEIRKRLEPFRSSQIIGLVPTMGALHAGHESLIQQARKEGDCLVVSIFVNPLQFGPKEDYTHYPRTPEADLDFCRKLEVDLIFEPEVEEMYPTPSLTSVEVTRITDHLCGPFRPGHFSGVATVVAKLFHIIQPQRAYFGEKDAQQLRVIERMVSDLNLGVTVVAVPPSVRRTAWRSAPEISTSVPKSVVWLLFCTEPCRRPNRRSQKEFWIPGRLENVG